MLPGKSKLIPFQNGLTNSENDSINMCTLLVPFSGGAKRLKTRGLDFEKKKKIEEV